MCQWRTAAYDQLNHRRWLAVFVTFLLCIGVSCFVSALRDNSPRPVMIGAPLQVEIQYFDESPPGDQFHRGTRTFIFKNLSIDEALTIQLPALAVYTEAQPNNFWKVDKPVQWPSFAQGQMEFTLQPGGVRSFDDRYESLGSGTPGWCFVFGQAHAGGSTEGECYIGCVVTMRPKEN